MTYDDSRLLEILKKYNISPNQYFILYSVYAKDNVAANYAMFKQKQNEIAFTFDEITDLMKKGYLLNFNNSIYILQKQGVKQYMPTLVRDLLVSDEFADGLFIETEIAGEELWEKYPATFSYKIDGKAVWTKKGGHYNGIYYDTDMLKSIYSKHIGNDLELHQQVLQSIDKAISYKAISLTLREFIINKMWSSYETLGNDEQSNIRPL